jgi:hypothetical protein
VSKTTASPVTEPLALAHSDFAGPFSLPSLGGSRYVQIVIDSAAEVACVTMHPTKHSERAVIGLERFVTEVALPAGKTLKAVRTDDGGEFKGVFDVRCLELGVHHQRAPSYTQQLNGKAERALQTIIQRANSMLQHSRVPKSLWAEAVNTACYLYNRSPHSALDGKTPFEAITGTAPTIGHLRVFGTLCFLHVPKPQRDKLAPRAVPCIFVGYAANKPINCYRVYNPATRRVVESIHVVFHEGTLWADHGTGTGSGPNALEQEGDADYDITPVDLRSPEIQDGASAGNSDEDGESATDATRGAGVAQPEDGINAAGEGARPPLLVSLPPPPAIAHSAFLAVPGDPASYNEAMECADADKWMTAIHEEMSSLLKMNTWDVTELPPGRKAIGTKWVFKTKTNSAGEIVRYKARLVIQGFSQVEGIDFFETYAPVANIITVRTILAVATSLDWELEQMDVDTAFLNAPVEEEIYAAMPPGYVQHSPTGGRLVYRLRRSLYGLKQAPKNWNSVFNEWLVDQYGFKRSAVDTCLYIYISSDGDKLLIVVVYVDDLIIATNSLEQLRHFKDSISSAFNMKDLGPLEHFLGVRITRDREHRRLTLDQTVYIKSIIEKFNMAEAKAVVTPSADGPLSAAMAPASPDDASFMAGVPYRNVVGSLLYAAVVTRPDISNAVREVSRFMHNPGRAHWSACQRILRYLKGTADFKLVYDFSKFVGKTTPEPEPLIGYCDADHAGDVDTRKSTTGYIFFYGGAAISWSSRLQPTVAISSTEAEYMALTEAVNETIFLRQLLTDIRLPQQDTTIIYEDNQGAMKLASNPMHHRRTKHIDVRYHHIRHHIDSGTVKLVYVKTKEQLADCLTKGVDNSVLKVLTASIFCEF